MKPVSDSHPPARKPWPTAPAEVHEVIGRRAKEIYIRNGKIPGHDMENWFQAEAEVLSEFPRTAVVVRLNGVQYVGEYHLDSADGYTPGEFAAGDPVPIRFEGDKMMVKRRNGKQLETTVVKKIG